MNKAGSMKHVAILTYPELLNDIDTSLDAVELRCRDETLHEDDSTADNSSTERHDTRCAGWNSHQPRL